MMKLIASMIVIFLLYHFFISNESGCSDYASNFSCKYVLEKATYDVYYWHRVRDGNPEDEKYIGTTTGLIACKNTAVNHALRIQEQWDERSYICILKKDGRNLEKHRLLN